MADDAVRLHDGTFWLADHPDKRVPGRLDLTGESPVLSLMEPLIPVWNEDPTDQGSWILRRIGPDFETLTIYGQLQNPKRRVSLLKCFTRRYDQGQHLQAGYVLLNGHVSTDARFSSACFRLRHLDVWAQLSGLSLTESEDRTEIVYDHVQPLRVDLPSPLNCRLELAADSTTEMSHRNASVQHTATFYLEELPDVPIGAIWWALGALSELFTLAMAADCPVTHLEVVDAASGQWLEVADPRLDRSPGEDLQQQGGSLLYRDDMDLQTLATWIGRYNDLRPIPAVLAREVSARNRVLESRLFELASAAEGLNRRIQDTKRTSTFTKPEARKVRKAAREAAGDNEELQTRAINALQYLNEVSYSERLCELLKDAQGALPGLEEWDQDEWKGQVIEARNGLAHRLPSYPGTPWEDRWQGAYVLAQSLRWLLTTLLLLEAGVNSAALARRLIQHRRFSIFREQAREWSPAVFRASHGEPADGSSVDG